MPQMVQVPLPRPPNAAEIEEAKTVRALQVRTNAVQFAIAALDHQAVRDVELVELAATIEAYLLGMVDADTAPAPVLAHSQAG